MLINHMINNKQQILIQTVTQNARSVRSDIPGNYGKTRLRFLLTDSGFFSILYQIHLIR